MSAVGEGPQSAPIRTWREFIAPVPLTGLAWSFAQIAFFLWPTVSTLAQRACHVSFALVLALLLTGAKFRGAGGRAANLALAFLAALPGLYVTLSVDRLMNERIAGVDAPILWDYVFGLLLVVLILEASRRVLGIGITLLAVFFVAYNFAGPWIPGGLGHSYGGLGQFVDAQFLSLNGVYGVPTGVSTHVVFYFILFAAVFDIFGGGRMIIELAMALTGKRVGGPAKAAVVASGLMGSVSGSAVANVMSTGIFTIPLMKRIGYEPRFAASVEAVASTGGQLVPPVMGAAAFVMADLLQTPYSGIAIAAIIPSILYYAGLLFVVDLQARKLGLGSMSAAALPRLGTTLRELGHMLIPLVWLCYQVVAGYPVDQAAMQAAGLSILLGTARRTTRTAPIEIARALQVAAERTISVALPCALAGIIVAVIAYSGLGTKFTSLMVLLSGGWLPATLLLAALGALILGCGMPTTSAYIMAAVLIAPALVLLELDPLVAHFFIFYFAILSMVTPPVALASYAAAAIADAPASETGWRAFTLAMPGFVIPFAIVVHPGLLMTGDVGDAAWGFFNVFVGFVALAVSITGFLFVSLSRGWRVWFAVIGIANVLPGMAVSVATLSMLAGSAAWLGRQARRSTRTGVRAT